MKTKIDWKKYTEKIVYIYLCILCSLFLFYFQNFYYDITNAKFKFYTILTIIMIIVASITSILSFFTNKKKIHKLNLSGTDLCIIFLLITFAISTLLTDYKQASLYGYGRHMGLFFYILMAISYYFVSRYYKQQQSVILLYLGSVSVVVLIGLAQFFDIDPLGFFYCVSDYKANLYLSTIGNINFFSTLICLSLPLEMVLFIYAKQKNSRFIYGIMMIIGFIGLLIANTDSGYLGMLIVFSLLFFYTIRDFYSFKRYIFTLITFLTTYRLLGLLIVAVGDQCRAIHSLSYFLSCSVWTLVLLLLLILFYVAMDVYREKISLLLPTINKIVMFVLVISIILLIGAVIYFTCMNTKSNIGFLENYLRFNEKWGTGRGQLWNRSLYCFGQASIIHKLFGSGLDSTVYLLVENFGNTMLRYDNAHNEWIQYLLTSGTFGVTVYASIFISVIKKSYAHLREEPYVFGVVLVIICYLVQSIVNISQPITTPIMFMFIAILENYLKNYQID